MSKQQEELERIIIKYRYSVGISGTRTIETPASVIANAILSAGYIKKDEVELDEREIYELIIMTRSLEDHNFVLKLAHAIASSAKAIVK